MQIATSESKWHRFPARAGTDLMNRLTMHNLIEEPLIRVRLTDATTRPMSLPEVYDAMSAERVLSFPALRPHQRHAWHAFLAQLGTVALHCAGHKKLPSTGLDWPGLIRNLTPAFGSDEPWCLIVEDPAHPAFMQCPAPNGFDAYRGRAVTPDDLDILVTAKNHDVKRTVAAVNAPDDWIFALIDLQTMAGFLGAGNYGIARMNGGFSARPCLGLAPAEGGPGAHLFHDIDRMLAGRDALLNGHSDYFDPDHGLALTWMEPWDGTDSLDLRRLDPYFIEICRRVRLLVGDGKIFARTAGSKAVRIAAKEANGNLGDFWTPVNKDAKALSLSSIGFRYDRLYSLIFNNADFTAPPAMKVDTTQSGRWRLVARGVAGGQGKTEGYHERSDIAFDRTTVSALFGGAQRDELAQIAAAQIEEIQEVEKALRFGIAVVASGGKPPSELTKADRAFANPYARRLDALADAAFFADLENRFLAAEGAARDQLRAEFAQRMIAVAETLLNEATAAVPCPAIRRHRARARANTAFRGRLRRPQSVFSDQPEIFDTKEASNVA